MHSKNSRNNSAKVALSGCFASCMLAIVATASAATPVQRFWPLVVLTSMRPRAITITTVLMAVLNFFEYAAILDVQSQPATVVIFVFVATTVVIAIGFVVLWNYYNGWKWARVAVIFASLGIPSQQLLGNRTRQSNSQSSGHRADNTCRFSSGLAEPFNNKGLLHANKTTAIAKPNRHVKGRSASGGASQRKLKTCGSSQ
jgi:hypothetical protein